MVDIRGADGEQSRAWAESYGDRIRSWHLRFDHSSEWLDDKVEHKLVLQPNAVAHTFVIADGPVDVGYLAMRLAPEGSATAATVKDLWIRPDHRRRGIGTSVREWAEGWAAERATKLFVTFDPDDPALMALFATYEVVAQTMMKRLGVPDALPDGVEGGPMIETEFDAWVDESTRGYADQIADSGSMTYADALARARAQTAELLPQGLRTPGHSFWTIYADGVGVATNWLRHQRDPGTSFVYSVEAHEQYRGKGYGRAAMAVGEMASLAAGDTHLSLNVFGHNHVAIGLYSRMGYELVDQSRSIDLASGFRGTLT